MLITTNTITNTYSTLLTCTFCCLTKSSLQSVRVQLTFSEHLGATSLPQRSLIVGKKAYCTLSFLSPWQMPNANRSRTGTSIGSTTEGVCPDFYTRSERVKLWPAAVSLRYLRDPSAWPWDQFCSQIFSFLGD